MPTTASDRTDGAAVPVTAYDRADGLRSAVAYKGSCLVASFTAITLSGLQTIDGEALAAGDRVLVAGQADQTINGIYLASTGVWARAADFSRNDDVVEGTTFRVNRGAYAGRYVLTTEGQIDFGTSALTFAAETTSASDASIGTAINASTSKAVPAAPDKFSIWDAAGSALKHVTWTNIMAELALSFGDMINSITLKDTPVDADEIVIADSAAGGDSKAVTLTNLWANYLKAKADALYQPIDTILTTLSALADGAGTLTNNGSGTLSWAAAAATGPTLLTEQATTSGTTKDFTVPAGINRFTVMLDGVSNNNTTGSLGVQLGDAGGVETTGYVSRYAADAGSPSAKATDRFILYEQVANGDLQSGTVIFSRMSGNKWVSSGVLNGDADILMSSGIKTLSDELTTVRIISSATFDAGNVNVSWE